MLRGLFRAPNGVIGLGAVSILLLIAIVAPLVFGESARTLDLSQANQNPSWQHLLGTDRLGRDIFLRILTATRISVGAGLAATAIASVIGIPLGVAAGLSSGASRIVMLRAIDTLLAFPIIVVALFVDVIMGSGGRSATLGVGFALSIPFARVASTLSMSVGAREYIQAARVVGVSTARLFLRYVLPNVAEPLIIQSTVAVSASIVATASLSFLGLGVQPPDFDWGRMLTEGLQSFYFTPAAALGPAAAIAVTSMAFGYSGEALARAMNPVLWSGRSGRGRSRDLRRTPEGRHAWTGTSHPEGDPRSFSTGDSVLEVRDLVVDVPSPNDRSRVRVVDGVSFSIGQGEAVGIVGESGSGKTMTAMGIAGLVQYPGTASGWVVIAGNSLRDLPQRRLAHLLGVTLAFVFQNPSSSFNPALRLSTQLTEGAEVHRKLPHATALELAVDRLREVNLPNPEAQLDRHPHELSGGMAQRAMIAMGLVNEPALLIADEPTTALDVTIQAQIMDLLSRTSQKRRLAILLISHNLALVSQSCDRILVMYAGRIVEEGPSGDLISQPLHPYTKALMAVVPEPSVPRSVRLASISGQPPDPSDLPPGCAFHPRCPVAVGKCRTEVPPLTAQSTVRRVACWVANNDIT